MVGVFIIATTLVVTGVLQVNSVVNANNGGVKGWIKAESHIGPSGETTMPERPGWGFGDKNHNHTGPPGKSTFPHDEHEDGHGNMDMHEDKHGRHDDD